MDAAYEEADLDAGTLEHLPYLVSLGIRAQAEETLQRQTQADAKILKGLQNVKDDIK